MYWASVEEKRLAQADGTCDGRRLAWPCAYLLVHPGRDGCSLRVPVEECAINARIRLTVVSLFPRNLQADFSSSQRRAQTSANRSVGSSDFRCRTPHSVTAARLFSHRAYVSAEQRFLCRVVHCKNRTASPFDSGGDEESG